MFYSLQSDWSRFFKQLMLVLAAVMLFSDCCVKATILCADRDYKSCAHTISEQDLRVLVPVRKQHKRAIFFSLASNRRSAAQPCRWKLCGASYTYQGSKRRL